MEPHPPLRRTSHREGTLPLQEIPLHTSNESTLQRPAKMRWNLFPAINLMTDMKVGKER